MPALKLFGRKWLAATDDFVYPGLFEIAFRLVWLVLVAVVLCRYYEATWECSRGGDLVRIYLAGKLALLGTIVCVLMVLVNRSAQGAVMDTEARRFVPAIVATKILLIVPEIMWNVLGSLWIFSSIIECGEESFTVIVVETLVLFNWLLLAVTVFGLALVFDPLGSVQLSSEEAHHRRVTGLWMWRFQWAFCWVRKDRLCKEAFQQVAALFSCLFRGTDLVPSDFIAGFILLRVKQKREAREYRRHELLADEPSYTTDINEVMQDTPSWMSLELALHYLKYSTATYSWPFVMYRWPFSGLCRLAGKLVCCSCLRQKPTNVVDDNCCLCNLAGLRHLCGIPTEDILYASFQNCVFQVPFFVLLDHKTSSVVVAIRGSISLRDIFTDFTAGAEKFEVEGLPDDTMAHKGMVMGVKHIKSRLEDQKILDSAFALYPTYKLIIVGHSLGAGIGVLLALLLRPKYPEVKVYAMSPPAAVLTREAARFTEQFTFSVGVGDDFVMRLSVDSIENLRNNIVDALRRSRLPKYRVMLNGFGYAFFGVPNRDLDSVWKADEIPSSTIPNDVPLLESAEPKHESAVVADDLTVRRFSRARLFTPGRILHITRRKKSKIERQGSEEQPRFQVRWAIAEEFMELQALPRMLLDHLPERVEAVLQSALLDKEALQPAR
ncbi:diacylglycerol lipase-beta-like [Bacillus rossius redtenbacheri]|uniref:diacylglycerol lipase-beta-like n=1 Tax=Bacillus rossius redtenbacheri TaxID=93214 RepID=UPI002FDF098C